MNTINTILIHTIGIPNLIGMVINFPQDRLAKELAALVINLGHNPRNNELFIANKGKGIYGYIWEYKGI